MARKTLEVTIPAQTVNVRESYDDIDEMREDNKAIGHHWFSPDTMRYFRTRIHGGVIAGHYFITSEQFQPLYGAPEPRRYTVRTCSAGHVDTIGDFGAYESLADARRAVKALVS